MQQSAGNWFDRDARRAFADAAPLAVLALDAAGRLEYANERWWAMTGFHRDDPGASSWLRVVERDDRHRVLEAARQLVARRGELDVCCRIRRADSVTVPVHARGAAVCEEGALLGYTIWVTDISAEVAERARAERLSSVLEQSSDFVTLIDLAGELIYANETVCSFFGVTTGDDLRAIPRDHGFTDASVARLREEALPALRRDGFWTGELVLVAPDGREVPVLQSSRLHVDEGTGRRFIAGVGRDISALKDAQRRLAASEARFRALAEHDPLTGLPNRTTALERLRRLEQPWGTPEDTAVLFVDIDDFKDINDTFGHELGDRVLVELATRLREGMRPGDFVARLGGDEFVVVCPGVRTPEAAVAVGNRVLAMLREPFVIEGARLRLTVSVGISTLDDSAPAELLQNADAAMYHAKRGGRARVEHYRDLLDLAAG